jgi:hypothetical protein
MAFPTGCIFAANVAEIFAVVMAGLDPAIHVFLKGA